MIDPRLRSALVCPKCRGDLTDAPDVLICEACQLRYPVREGVPYLLPELASAHSPISRPGAGGSP